MKALDAGKHIFCEKPVGWNLREVEEVAARVRQSDRVVQVGYHKLYDPGFAYARSEVGKIPDLGLVRIAVLHPTNELGLSPHRIRRGGGVIVEGHVDPGSWEQQVSMQRESFTGGALKPLVDEALGSRKDDPRLRLGYGHLTLSLIHQVYMMFGFLGEPLRVASAEIWREGMSIHVVVTALFCFIWSWNDFMYALILTRNAATTLPVAVSAMREAHGLMWGEVSATAPLGTVPIIILAIILQKYLVRGLSLGSLK
jgi:hypothetical protein